MELSGNNIKIHHNHIHHCPHSGVRVDKGDYIAIEVRYNQLCTLKYNRFCTTAFYFTVSSTVKY